MLKTEHFSIQSSLVSYLFAICMCYYVCFRSVLTKFIQEVRSMNDGSLNMLKYEEVINRAAQLILDHQERSQVRSQFVKPIKIAKQNAEKFITLHSTPILLGWGGGHRLFNEVYLLSDK